jgi:hypothetical protein
MDLRLRNIFDVPEEVANAEHSPEFAKFLWNWFGDTSALTHGELDITFLRNLTPRELPIAKDLIRRNLKLRYVHIIEGASALGDVEAAPVLRRMLEEETDPSWRLTIAGALWKLVKDPLFISCLDQAKAHGGRLFAGTHLLQVLWLGDDRAIDFLIDLLAQQDLFVRTQALGLLNRLESGQRPSGPAHTMPHQPDYYRRRRDDPAFRQLMTEAVRKWNSEMKNGR